MSNKRNTGDVATKAVRGAVWQIGLGGWQTIVRLGASTILARKLDPSDFGLFGMALLVSQLISVLTNLGMGTGIVAKKDPDEKDLNTCFWSMVGVRVAMFLLAETCAPLAAFYFRDPRVTNVIRLVGFNFLFVIPGVMPNVLLTKELRFKALVITYGLCTLLESSLAVILAISTDLRYWALVIPMLISSLISGSTLFTISGWRPKLIFDKDSFKYLFRYGINGLGFSITNYLHQNVDYLIVGRILGTESLGLYEFAYKIPHLVLNRISRPVGGVVFPALSKVQDDDEKLIKGFITSVKYVTLIVFPILGGLAVTAKMLVPLLWGEKWVSIVVPMQILCACAAMRCAGQPVGSIFLVKNRPDIPFKFSIVTFIVTLITVSIGGSLYGINGVALGMLLSTIPYMYIINLACVMTSTSILRYIKGILPNILALLSFIVCSSLTINFLENLTNNFVSIVAAVLIGLIGYIFSLYLFFNDWLDEITHKIRSTLVTRKVSGS